jgi:endoglycosylceramidase
VAHVGRWLIDPQGRVLLPHGVNLVAKQLDTPAQRGFGDDDAAWLEANGFDAVRLGFSPDALLPAPGTVNQDYVDSFVNTVAILRAHGLLVLVDQHQDGWGPATAGNGFPAWMTITHGAENTMTGFPLYYVTNPAIQAAFESFWANENGPDEQPLQSAVAAMLRTFAEQLSDAPNVLGYDLINEPWPGTDWMPCLNAPGCADQDAAKLDAYYARMAAAIRGADSAHILFGEPFVLFNFGMGPTHIALPGGDAAGGMSFHMYTVDPAAEPQVVAYAVDWSAGTGGALLCSEFGASTDSAAIDRQVGLLDRNLIPWLFWSYDENVATHLDQQMSEANVVASSADTLVRPHPLAVAGTPLSHEYDLASHTLTFSYSTTGPGDRQYAAELPTIFKVAPRTYPTGYRVTVSGGRVTSDDGAPLLTVVADVGAQTVSVVVSPAAAP